MAGFDALSVRDLVALVVIATRTLREGISDDAEALVTKSFDVADEFVRLSEGRWAEGARGDRVRRDQRKRKGNGNGNGNGNKK